jgi:acyl-CoA dehydrogenase
MVDFSLTNADERLMDLSRAERARARTVARELDRVPESQVLPNRDHEVVAGMEAPYDALANETDEISGKFITEALMQTVSSFEFDTRRNRDTFASWVINHYGTPEQKKVYGQYAISVGITEPGAGADPSSLRSTAKYDPATDEYVLNGEKTFISNIHREDGALVLVKGEPDETGKRPFWSFVVLKGTPGFSTTPPFRKLGIHSNELAGFVMQDVRVPALAKFDGAFAKMQARLTHYRPVVAAQGLGSCRSILDFTHEKLAEAGLKVDYAKGRASRSFAEDKLIRLEALWHATWCVIMRAKWLEEQFGATSEAMRTESTIAKAMGGKATRQITQGCMELLGAEGLSEEYLAEKWFRDARIIDIYMGPGEVHRLSIARSLLGYRKGELD